MGSRTHLVVATAVGGVALAAALVAVRARAPEAPAVAPPIEARLDVEISGCSAIVRGPVCEVAPESELRLYVPDVDAPLRVAFDDRVAPATTTAWPDGRTLAVKPPAGAARVRVTSEGSRRATWEMTLAPAAPVPDVVAKARALRKDGNLDAAAALLVGALASDAGPRSKLLSLSARIDYARGHIDDAVARYREAIALHTAEGRSSEAADDAFALVFLLLERRRYGEVRPLLAAAAEASRDWPDGRASVTYNEGILARDTGDLRLALRLTREAEAHAARLGWTRLRLMASTEVARQLLDLERARESFDIYRNMLATDGDAMIPCDRGDLLDNVGWAADRVAQSNEDAGIDARDPLAQALALFRASCPDPNRIANALVDLAFARLQRHELAAARDALAEARRAQRDPGVPVVLFWEHLAGSIALESHDARAALDAFGREAASADALGSPDERRVAAADRAEAMVAVGDAAGALAVLDTADALLDATAAFVPLGEGRSAVIGARDPTALRVALLVAAHRDEEAMLAARRALARLLAGLRGRAAIERLAGDDRAKWETAFARYATARQAIDQEASRDWELPADRLAAALARRKGAGASARAALDEAVALLAVGVKSADRAPRALARDELELLYFPTPAGWFAFSRDARGTRAIRLGPVDPSAPPEELSRRLLEPNDAAIARATRIHVLANGVARGVDVHALPWRGALLIDHAVVDYALDLGDAEPSPGAKRALVVADPNGDLPGSREEAGAVARAFAIDPSWRVDVLQGSDARSDAVRAGLADAAILHYAGHARFGGTDGMESALPLASHGSLVPGDVLALPRVPPFVSLFGCETARDTANGAPTTLGLTSAFLVAGSRAVIATSRDVDDALARDIAAELYSRILASPADSLDAPSTLRDALRAVRAKSPAADWSAFRAVVR